MHIREILLFGCLITAGGIAGAAPSLTISLSKGATVTTNATGNFVFASSPEVGQKPLYVATADLNGDGSTDLISADYADSSLTTLTNIGGGLFSSNATYFLTNAPIFSSPYSVISADVNGDNKADLITANVANTNSLSVLTNDGFGGFQLDASYPVGSYAYSVVASDVNGDSKIDLICVNYYSNSITVLTNDGAGHFALRGIYPAGTTPAWLVAADVNGDHRPDIITANTDSDMVTVLTNDGSGAFLIASSYPVVEPVYVSAADVNGDGSMDLITASYTGGVLVLTNTGSGAFVSNAMYTVGTNTVCVVPSDVNGDGHPDLISVDIGQDTLTVLTNDGGGHFALSSVIDVGFAPYSVAAADFNGDGFPDLVAGYQYGNALSVLTNATVLQTNFSNLVLSWPTNAPGYSVQENSSLRGTNWATLANVPTVVGAHYQVLVNVMTNTAFFRLVSAGQ